MGAPIPRISNELPKISDMSDLTGVLIDGRYQLLRQLATGGMASIYEALDTRLDRRVAVKIMHSHLAQDEQFVERFIREAKAAALLAHPNIVSVQDQGWNQSGVPAVFLVMEMVEGHTLRDYLNEQGALTIQDGIKFLLPVLSALAAAHAMGIVHRDIKPENILISLEGRIKVADFGLAKGSLLGTTMTVESSVLLGSVSYLSPEQVQRGIADSRSDVYSTAITAFEIFTGQKPFEGEAPIQIAYMHVNNRVPRISTLRPEIPATLDDLIYRASSSDPDDRPRDASEFHKQLAKIAHEIDPAKHQLSLELDIPIAPLRPKQVEKRARSSVKERARAATSIPEVAKDSTAQIRRKKKLSKRVRRNRYIAVGIAILVGALSWYLLIGPGSEVSIPSVVGANEAEATSSLLPLGLTSIVAERRFSEDLASGKIIQSIPEGGGRVAAGGVVKLIVSKGPERFVIPVLTHLTPGTAVDILKKTPLTVGTVTQVFDSNIPSGFVISSIPRVGSKVMRSAVVSLIVSKGVETIPTASYIGKSGEQALNELTGAGFKVTSTNAFSESVLIGGVISQDPAGGGAIPKGAAISLVVSKGSEYVFIPNLYSVPEASAVRALQEMDLAVSVKIIGKKSVKSVTNIAPKVGTKVKRGSPVTITVG